MINNLIKDLQNIEIDMLITGNKQQQEKLILKTLDKFDKNLDNLLEKHKCENYDFVLTEDKDHELFFTLGGEDYEVSYRDSCLKSDQANSINYQIYFFGLKKIVPLSI